jgi:hypothetical protein
VFVKHSETSSRCIWTGVRGEFREVFGEHWMASLREFRATTIFDPLRPGSPWLHPWLQVGLSGEGDRPAARVVRLMS